MRYQNWDVLVFPGTPDQSKVPLQEFKTACTVIQDPETHSFQTSPHLLPTITSFIPALIPGSAFRISIHCWQNPDLSRYIQALKKSSDSVVFEARLFVDGRIVGSRWFHQNGPWPTVIEMSIDVDKHGEFEKLKFPAFHKELLSQSYWNAGDEFGRIKLVISEGFAREHLTYPYERVKNVAAFSFQHAPLDVLEQSNIAWPNQAMWRQVSLVGPYTAQQATPRKLSNEIEVHSHSPRRGSQLVRVQPTRSMGGMALSVFPRPAANLDPFTDQIHSAFSGWRQSSGNDVSMPDYSSSGGHTRANTSRQVTDPMSISGPEATGHDATFDSLCDAMGPHPPANTPQNGENVRSALPITFEALTARKAGAEPLPRKDTPKPSGEFIVPPDDVILDRPNSNGTETIIVHQAPAAPEGIKSRKENIHQSTIATQASTASVDEFARKVSQTFASAANSNNKRQRVITPASSKVIDDEDEPRSSPSTRKVSRTSAKDCHGQKRVLSNITNV